VTSAAWVGESFARGNKRAKYDNFLRKEATMKTFKQIAAQCERIAKLYEKGFGTEKMLERAERIFFAVPNVGLCF